MWWLFSIFRYWKFVTILGLAGAVGWAFWHNQNQEKEITKLQLNIQQKTFYLESLEDAVDMQNGLIDKMAEQNEVYEDKLKLAKNRIVYIKKQEQSRIQAIESINTGKSCEDNMDFLLNQAQDENKWAE